MGGVDGRSRAPLTLKFESGAAAAQGRCSGAALPCHVQACAATRRARIPALADFVRTRLEPQRTSSQSHCVQRLVLVVRDIMLQVAPLFRAGRLRLRR